MYLPKRAPALVGVLDLATGTDPTAAALASTSRVGASGRVSLQRVRAATLLTARSDGDRVEVKFSSSHVDGAGEDVLVEALSKSMAKLRAEGAVLVTFNGRRHDLPILERRLSRHLCFASKGVSGWLETGALHVDMMTDVHPSTGKWSSLQDEAAGLGIAIPGLPPAQTATACALQCDVDCAVTYLLHLHVVASRTGDGAALLAGWRGLADAIDAEPVRLAHLRSLRRPAGLSDAQWRAPELSQ